MITGKDSTKKAALREAQKAISGTPWESYPRRSRSDRRFRPLIFVGAGAGLLGLLVFLIRR